MYLLVTNLKIFFLIFTLLTDKDIKCKNKSTPLHILVKSNVFLKQDLLNIAAQEKKADVT